jgi:uncharacterized membrane protein
MPKASAKMTYDDEKQKPLAGPDAADDRVLGRLLAFSDGVFAIAITLLIIGVVIPEGTTDFNLNSVLSSLWPNYLAFLISFFVIGLYWIVHVRQFRFVRKYDSGLLWLNLMFLLFIVIMPFTTSIVSKYSSETAVIIYAANVALVGYMRTASWFYSAHNHRLIDKRLSSTFIRRTTIMNLIAPSIFTLSIGVAFIDKNLAQYIWISIFVVYVIAMRVFRTPSLD